MLLMRRDGRGRYVGPALAGVLLALLAAQLAVEPTLGADSLLVAFSVVACVLAGASRQLPFVGAAGVALLTVALDMAGIEVTEAPFAVFLAVLVVAFHAGERLEGTGAVGALILLLAAELLVGMTAGMSPMDEWAAAMVANAALWTVGVVVRRVGGRADRLAGHLAEVERGVEERQRQAIEMERARIARELHDVIAHSVAVMTVQAGAAETALGGELDRAREALEAIQETGRRTVEDLRHLLGVLRESPDVGSDPQPGLHRLDELADEVAAAGLPVRLDVRGPRVPLSPGLDVAAYRIVQEALTNALRHGSSSGADVSVEYTPSALNIVIENDAAEAIVVRPGHGLTGMQERAAVFGGRLEFGATAAGSFRVSALLPLDGARS